MVTEVEFCEICTLYVRKQTTWKNRHNDLIR